MTSVEEQVVKSKIPLLLDVNNGRYQMPSNLEKTTMYKEKFSDVLKSGIVKLVILDLDSTFWKGTLAEINSGFEYIQNHHEFVKNMVNAGIMCSICSYNDYTTVKEFLQQKGLWDYFIFPQVSVNLSKGLMIKNLLSLANLRHQNAIFVDDEQRNIEEARYTIPGLFCITPEFFFCVSEMKFPSFANSMERLNQYKILERKEEDRKEVGSNKQFLQLSQVTVFVATSNLDQYLDRVNELMQRANMLNFTKRIETKSELAVIFNSPGYHKGVVRVTDVYGDYGIVGFFAKDLQSNVLIHFFFSCRVMNMGVENCLYHNYLLSPTIESNGDNAQLIQLQSKETSFVKLIETSNLESEKVKYEKTAFIQGACTLQALKTYIESFRMVSVSTCDWSLLDLQETAHTQSITIYNKGIIVPPVLAKFLPNEKLLRDVDYNYYVLETHQDVRKKLYKLKESDIYIALGNSQWTLEESLKRFESRSNFSAADSDWWLQNMELAYDSIPLDMFRRNLHFIRDSLPKQTILVLLTHAEVGSSSECIDPLEKRVEVNKELDEFASSQENVILLDVRKHVTDYYNHTSHDNVSSHYSREIYWKLAEDFNEAVLKMIGAPN
jgi:FkbH-like protein